MLLEYNGVTVTKTSNKDIALYKKAGYKEVVKPGKKAKPKKEKADEPKAGK